MGIYEETEYKTLASVKILKKVLITSESQSQALVGFKFARRPLTLPAFVVQE